MPAVVQQPCEYITDSMTCRPAYTKLSGRSAVYVAGHGSCTDKQFLYPLCIESSNTIIVSPSYR